MGFATLHLHITDSLAKNHRETGLRNTASTHSFSAPQHCIYTQILCSTTLHLHTASGLRNTPSTHSFWAPQHCIYTQLLGSALLHLHIKDSLSKNHRETFSIQSESFGWSSSHSSTKLYIYLYNRGIKT